MAPLDAVHDAVRRTIEAGTARLRIAHVVAHPAPACMLPKHAELDFGARVALQTEPEFGWAEFFAHHVSERWPWLAGSDAADDEGPSRCLFVGERMLWSDDDGWTDVGAPGVKVSPFGIFDRLAAADAAVVRDGVLRFRVPPPPTETAPQFGDLRLDGDGRIDQIAFSMFVPRRRRLPKAWRTDRAWVQVDVLELGMPLAIDVPDPLPAPFEPEDPTWRGSIEMIRTFRDRRRQYRAAS